MLVSPSPGTGFTLAQLGGGQWRGSPVKLGLGLALSPLRVAGGVWLNRGGIGCDDF